MRVIFMTSMFLLGVMLTAAIGQKQTASTVAQVNGSGSAVGCPGTNAWTETDLTLTYASTGKPVLISFNTGASLSANSGVQFQPLVDGKIADQMTVYHNVGMAPESPSLSMYRAYNVPRGTHIFSIQWLCHGGASITDRWMTVTESN